jgi:hypothetical protein
MFTKDELKNFRSDFIQTVKGLEQKYNVKIEIGNIGYSETSFHSKMTVTRLNDSGKKQVDTSSFGIEKQILGLKADLGQSFITSGGKVMTIVGINLRSTKKPVKLTDKAGNEYRAGVDYVNSFFKG